MNPVYISPKDLPEVIASVLRSEGCPIRSVIPVYVSETASMAGLSSDGRRAFTALLNLDTGASDVTHGSWGGANPFARGSHDAVDHDTTPRALPENGCVIHGYIGGPSGGRASITVHPSRIAKLLPATGVVSEREGYLLAIYSGLNARGRAEYFRRNTAMTPTKVELECLAERGLIRLAKNGAVTITADGKNVATRNAKLY
jgi:hypothetical protein